MRILLTKYNECYNFIRTYFLTNEFGTRSSLTIGFLGYLGFNVSRRWMKSKTDGDIKIKFTVRRVVGKIMKYLVGEGYAIKFTNTTWKKTLNLPEELNNDEKPYFDRNGRISL